jgi:hypothetical protein
MPLAYGVSANAMNSGIPFGFGSRFGIEPGFADTP